MLKGILPSSFLHQLSPATLSSGFRHSSFKALTPSSFKALTPSSSWSIPATRTTFLRAMSTTMHAVQIPQHGDSSVLAWVPVPKPSPKPDQVLVKVAYAGVNFIDTYQRSGLYPQSMPFIVGREGSGEIVEVGPEAQGGFKVGDRVAFMAPGSYAEYDAIPTLAVAKLPASVSLEDVKHHFFFVRGKILAFLSGR